MIKMAKKIAAVHKQNSNYQANGETPKPIAAVFTQEDEESALLAFKVSLAILGVTLLAAAWIVLF